MTSEAWGLQTFWHGIKASKPSSTDLEARFCSFPRLGPPSLDGHAVSAPWSLKVTIVYYSILWYIMVYYGMLEYNVVYYGIL